MDSDVLKRLSNRFHSRMVEIRRHLHRYPELSYQEHETTDYIISVLDELEIPVERPLDTGCVGILKGGRESDRVVALRADIDALPIDEEGVHKAAFQSENAGVAHCCGHDGHTANLLGTAHILSELREELEGTVLLVFQPGEEQLPGGGRLLCETGYLQDKEVDVIYGLHTAPFLETGQVAYRNGPVMARPDEFVIEIVGKGGHAAYPHDAIDPIYLASQVVTMIQSIVSRNIDPTDPAVVTVGKIEGGTTYNIIPERVRMIGTVRTFSEENALFIKDRIEQIVKGVTSSAGASYEFDFNYGYPAVINPEPAVEGFRETATAILGEKSVIEMEKPIMAGEDFAFYQQQFPGVFFFLGSGSEECGSRYGWHHPRYNIDESCFLTGAALMSGLALRPIPGEVLSS